MTTNRRILFIILTLSAVLVFGTAGFTFFLKLSFIDSLYMTVITISTVGYGLIKPLTSPSQKIFVIILILGGVSTVAYLVSTLFQFTLEEYFGRRKRMQKQIQKLSNHYIIAGYGRVGKQIAIEFAKAKKEFVVIEKNEEMIKDLLNEGIYYIEGDATEDDTLIRAGIENAVGLTAALNSDADNVFMTLSAKTLNKNLTIVARANTQEAEAKLKAAGADRVISPSLIGARRMASMLLSPFISDYLDLISHSEKIEYRLEELTIEKNSTLADLSLESAAIRQKTGALVLSVKRGDKVNTNPDPSETLKPGDNLVVIGTSEQLQNLSKFTG